MALIVRGGATRLELEVEEGRLRLMGFENLESGSEYLRPPPHPWKGRVGNPFMIRVIRGKAFGTYLAQLDFKVTKSLSTPEGGAQVEIMGEGVPARVELEIDPTAVGVQLTATIWNLSDEALDMEVYLPMLVEAVVTSPEEDRVHLPLIAGSTLPISRPFRQAYIGQLAAPFIIQEGQNEGFLILDENKNDLLEEGKIGERLEAGENPFIMRSFISSDRFAGGSEARVGHFVAEIHSVSLKPGQRATFGPVLMAAFRGSRWRALGVIRERRASLPFRDPPDWLKKTFIIGEHGAEEGSFAEDLQRGLELNRSVSADSFHYYGYWAGDGKTGFGPYVSRGNYLIARPEMGGEEELREAVRKVHELGGRVLFYVEGMIVWRESEIGERAREWAIMNPDGSYLEIYFNFWHMCPACRGWQEWLAETCAELVRRYDADGVFIDSICATNYHPCYNPAHGHSSPYVWNWGVRELLRRVREALDEVKPEAAVLCEGCADIAREFADGFLSHGHTWSGFTLQEPITRAAYPLINDYESWGEADEPEKLLLWNFATGHRIYSHAAGRERVAPVIERVRRAFEAVPELGEAAVIGPMSVSPENVICYRLMGRKLMLAIANLNPRETIVSIPLPRGAKSIREAVGGEELAANGDRISIAVEGLGVRVLEVER